jgi:hypothetical protein
MDKDMAKENMYGLMVVFMKDIGKTTKLKDKEKWYILKAIIMKGNGIKIRLMEKVFITINLV